MIEKVQFDRDQLFPGPQCPTDVLVALLGAQLGRPVEAGQVGVGVKEYAQIRSLTSKWAHGAGLPPRAEMYPLPKLYRPAAPGWAWVEGGAL